MTSRNLQRTMFGDSDSFTPSVAEISGASPCNRQDGETTDPCGREAVPAPVSARRAKGEGLMMLVTSGRNGFGSSASAGLQRCLESRLMQRLGTAGSTLWGWTWRAKATPLRRRYFQRQALERRTSATGFSSVPTPNTPSGGPNSVSTATHTGGMDLDGCATLASVPTPMAGSPATETYNAAGNTDYSRRIVELASVTTPRSEDSQCAGAHRGATDTLHSQANLSAVRTPTACSPNSLRGKGQDPMKRMQGGHAVNLQDEVTLSMVTTPSARDWKDASGMSETGVDPDGSTRTRLDQLPRQAQLADSGETATGGSGETKSTGQLGQLDPAYSRWLMGVPPVWDLCAIAAWKNLKKR